MIIPLYHLQGHYRFLTMKKRRIALIKPSLSIVIPTYNERDNISQIIERLGKTLRNIKYEIIFVDDNSKDNTLYILQDLKKKYSNFNYIIRKEKNDLSKSILNSSGGLVSIRELARSSVM